MDERFLESVVHKRAPLLARLRGRSGHVVLGRRLRPFSLWHQELLKNIKSPFLEVWKTNPSSIQIFKSLYLATQVCQLVPFETLQGGWLQTLRRKCLVFRFWFCLGWRRRPGARMLRMLLEAAKFRAYMNDYCTVPIPFPNRKSKAVQSPVSAYQVELYRRFHPNLTEREIWAKGPADIAWANTASHEAHGDEISIMTKERMEAREIAMRGGRRNGNKDKGKRHV